MPTLFDIRQAIKLLDDIMAERPQTKLWVERDHKRPKFAICEALAVLEEGMKSEAGSIRFDYFSMDTRCLKLLRKLRLAVKDQLAQRLGPNVLDDETQLPILVGDILNMAAATNTTMISGDVEGVKVGSKILQDATQVFVQSDLIKKKGDVEVKKVRL